jgi:HSP20 family protein
MTKAEIAKASQTSRPRDVFSAIMRDDVFAPFEPAFARWPSLFRYGNGDGVVPELDVRENSGAITIEAELPGVDEKDVTVTMANGTLTIKGEKKEEKHEKYENYYLAERSYGTFERSLRLPDTVDDSKVEAKFANGVLKVTAAKKPEAVKAERKIEIKKPT